VLEVPAGKLEPGDEPERRARLELEEETGYLAGSLIAAGTVLATPGYSSERIHLFLAFELERVGQRLEEDERIEVVRLSFEELYRLADRGGIEDAKTLLAIHALRRRAT
jgi:ADP-ribose pyrophosphatase